MPLEFCSVLHSVKEQEDNGRPLSLVLVVRVDWKTASPPQYLVVMMKMLVLSAQPPVSTEFNINYNKFKDSIYCNDRCTIG